MHKVYLSLGSNLGDPSAQIASAVDKISRLKDTQYQQCSSLYENLPFGPVEQPNFMNAVLCIVTGLSPFELLKELKLIEKEMGRVDTLRWGPRVIDCDIILYDNLKIETPTLIIPHLGMFERDFVLIPLFEIAPDLVFWDGTNLRDRVKAINKRQTPSAVEE